MDDSQQAQPAAETPVSPTPCPFLEGRGDAHDPEIEALLDFEPVPRRFKKEDGWTAPLQRAFIAELAKHGSPTRACEALGKVRSGIDKVYKSKDAASFRAAWDSAIELAERRRAAEIRAEHAGTAGLRGPFIDHRRKTSRQPSPAGEGEPGQVLNEYGEWEDEDSYRRRAEEARDSIGNKLLRSRRLYLQEISGSAAKRAAFEILTELPIDWERAARMEPQPDEPWRSTNQRQPDMILTAESGWSFGEHGYGPDKKAELRSAIDEHRAEEGLEPIDWDEDDEKRTEPSP
jgi:hypothetical protein